MVNNVCKTALTLIALHTLSPVYATVTITAGEVDTIATALVGNQGSSSGTITDDPPADTGTSGLLSQTAGATAGPVGPGDLPTLPGTDRVLSAASQAEVDFTVPNGLSTALDLAFIQIVDGVGGYFTSGIADLRAEFIVDTVTDYELTGSYDVFENDLVWRLQLIGPGGALVNAATESGTSGTFSRSGTLQPDVTYILRSTITGAFASGELVGERRFNLEGNLVFSTDEDPGPDPDPDAEALPAAGAPLLGGAALVICAVAMVISRRRKG